MRRVVVHIDRVLLAGVRRVDSRALADGLGGELARVLAGPGGLPRWAAGREGAASLDGGRVAFGANTRPADLGRRVAQAVLTAKARR